jgi:hypothetical protein
VVVWRLGAKQIDGEEELVGGELREEEGEDGGDVSARLVEVRGVQEVEEDEAQQFLAPAWLGVDHSAASSSSRRRPWRARSEKRQRGEVEEKRRRRIRVRVPGRGARAAA